MQTKTRLVIFILIAILVLVYFFKIKIPFPASQNATQSDTKTQISNDQQSDFPRIVSTKPDPLEEAIISSTEVLEITFSHPLENVGEFKNRIEPKIDYKVALSSDRKTAKIIPLKPYELGATYTIFILPDSKFDGIGEWRKEKIFHFKTIRYRGI